MKKQDLDKLIETLDKLKTSQDLNEIQDLEDMVLLFFDHHSLIDVFEFVPYEYIYDIFYHIKIGDCEVFDCFYLFLRSDKELAFKTLFFSGYFPSEVIEDILYNFGVKEIEFLIKKYLMTMDEIMDAFKNSNLEIETNTEVYEWVCEKIRKEQLLSWAHNILF